MSSSYLTDLRAKYYPNIDDRVEEEKPEKPLSWTNNPITNTAISHPLITGALGVGTYILYKKRKKQDIEDKEKIDKVDVKFKREDIKSKE